MDGDQGQREGGDRRAEVPARRTIVKDRIADRLEIGELVQRYTDAGDRGKFGDLVSIFADDAEYVTPLWWTRGRDMIAEAMKRDDLGFFGPVRPTFMRHHLTTSRIVLADDDHATGRTYFINYSDIGADHAGVYVDNYERLEGRWLVTRREDRVDWQAPDSLYVPALPKLSRTPLADRPFIARAAR
jgi:hypothetical protein